jgi:NAD(P)H-hydrate repair Nnr-like enzyme with NAD(P)H-hydrate dehydratase domain
MSSTDYWQKQEPGKPLFPDILWSKPELKSTSGKLAIVGGNAHGFAAVAASYQNALKSGVGEVQVILPDVLKSKLPAAMTDAIFAPTNPSGGLASQALSELNAAANWANLILFIGDNGQNAETAGLFETFLSKDSETPVVITRDAVDLIKNAAETVLNRAPTHLIVSLSQLQKLFRAVYYPRVITFGQGIKQIAETLHKFTITYPCTITLWHSNNLFVAKDGQVITQEFTQPMRVWSGEVATREAAWQIWNTDAVQAVATSWIGL